MSPSPTFHFIPKKVLVTIATDYCGETEPQKTLWIEPEFADENGIMLVIDKFLNPGYPLRLHLVTGYLKEGMLTMATPDDFPFSMEVSQIPPGHIHLHRDIDDQNMHVTCMVPLTGSEDDTDIEAERLTNWMISEEGETDEDTELALYYGGLMSKHHVFMLDYSRGATESLPHVFHNVRAMQRHFLPQE